MGNSKHARSKWHRLRQRDVFVREASRRGVRSRSYFKLAELDRQFRLIKRGMSVLDLGAAPGGWSQYAYSKVGESGQVLAIDINGMAPVSGVEFMQVNLASNAAVAQVVDHLGERKVGIVLSDMAPNITGNSAIDAKNYADLYAALFKICDEVLARSGTLVFKFFQTTDTAALKYTCQLCFDRCRVCKPQSSRSNSQEAYLVARGFRSSLTEARVQKYLESVK